ncbi:hypothetical protein AB0E75_00420 [Streptomyces griseoviridis]|uniref:Uncharacterized protein n=3 Tax=Streptomyces TaxID=1883 RepID=A0ABT9LCZ3_STRGD|nr:MULTISPECIES: hypothetical protein [Streptomyces]MDP9681493.1 hypothetical protein [Streptomyces griseoviridis]GGS20606.1 hypothetical protein GCM10010238_06070 [Streptomyces niveoruber]GGS74175.1 hypothetical protein GCM10010240_04010 [Streptomyces griseoviridis]GGU44386.1 hypothetical protein GCM10010259_39230 [Streptomyces daghestanicus]GHI34514.1 hypothetical protein Sdagh_62440 [Streptomyces daghestanicus]
MNDREFVEQVRARPGLYGLNGTYHSTATFLIGFDQGRSGGLFRGFDEWLAVRRGERTNITWYAQVFLEALPGVALRGLGQPLTREQDQAAVDLLFTLLLSFLEVRDDRRALARMYADHEALK